MASRPVTILVQTNTSGARRDLARLDRSITGLGRSGSHSGHLLSRALGVTLRAGAVATGAGFLALGVGIKKSLDAAGDFQKQLSVLQAVSGATGDQMQRVSKLSIRLGNDIRLPATSAQDAALAMTELAKGGLNVRDSMHAARGSLELAAAGQIDVATAASVTATALNAFHLAGAQATHAADLLAGAANASAGDVTDFAVGLQFAGTAAHAAGQSIDLTVAALAEMANAGLSGSVAGTSLSQALRALQAPTSKAQDVMDKFGLSIYDAHGKMLPLDEIAQVFTKHLGGLTQQQQNLALQTIFGTRSVQAARIVFLGGRDALDKYRDRVSKAGNAQRLASAQTRGYRGAIQGFQSALETLAIVAGAKLLPVATDVARKLTNIVNAAGKLAEAKDIHMAVRLAFRMGGRVYDSLSEALFGGSRNIQRDPRGRTVAVDIDNKGIVGRLMDALRTAPWGDIGKRVGTALADGITFTQNKINDLVGRLTDALVANSDKIAKAGLIIALTLVTTATDPGFWKDHWELIIAALLAVFGPGRLAKIAGTAARSFGGAFLRIAFRLLERLPIRFQAIGQRAIGLVGRAFSVGWHDISGRAVSVFQNIFSHLPPLAGRAFGLVLRVGSAVFSGILRAATKIISRIVGDIGDIGKGFGEAGGAVRRLIGRIINVGVKIAVWLGVIDTVKSAFDKVKNVIDDIIDAIGRIHIPGGSLLSHVPGFASGTQSTPYGYRIVGEQGPELEFGPAGNRIIPMGQTRRMLGGDTHITIPLNLTIVQQHDARREAHRGLDKLLDQAGFGA